MILVLNSEFFDLYSGGMEGATFRSLFLMFLALLSIRFLVSLQLKVAIRVVLCSLLALLRKETFKG